MPHERLLNYSLTPALFLLSSSSLLCILSSLFFLCPLSCLLCPLSCLLFSSPLFPSPLLSPRHGYQCLHDVSTLNGQLVVLECRLRGTPPLQVMWYREDEQVLDSDDFRILRKSESVCDGGPRVEAT